jgi:hypothetical protein
VRFVASVLALASVTAGVASGTSGASTKAHAGSSSSTTATTTPASDITWGIQPSTAKGPTGKPAFVYDNVTPGSTLRGYVGVTNYSKVPATFAVYPADAVNTVTGGFDVLDQGQKSVGVGAWTTLARSTITIPAGLEDNIPFTLRVPADTTPGDHYGGIVAQLSTVATNAKGDKFKFQRRVGVRIYLRVVGPLHPSLTIEHLTLSYDGTANPFAAGKATVHYTVANTGNMALAASQVVTITSIFGSLASAHLAPVANLVPGQSQEVTATLDGVPPAGPIDANVVLVPAVPKGTTTQPHPKVPGRLGVVRQSTGTWAWPWFQLILFVLLLVLLWLWRRWRKRRGTKLERAVAAALEEGRREAEAGARDEDDGDSGNGLDGSEEALTGAAAEGDPTDGDSDEVQGPGTDQTHLADP